MPLNWFADLAASYGFYNAEYQRVINFVNGIPGVGAHGVAGRRSEPERYVFSIYYQHKHHPAIPTPIRSIALSRINNEISDLGDVFVLGRK